MTPTPASRPTAAGAKARRTAPRDGDRTARLAQRVRAAASRRPTGRVSDGSGSNERSGDCDCRWRWPTQWRWARSEGEKMSIAWGRHG
eukprot:354498-Chlamydomonas_euryale.AAC.5